MELPDGIFSNNAKRFRWNSCSQNTVLEEHQVMGLPFELTECLNKIAGSQYMQDLSQLKEAQVNCHSLYAMATAHMQPNFLWLQYSLSRSKAPDSMYTSIIKAANNSSHHKSRKNRYSYNEVTVGLGCNAQYKDGSWYRALVTQKIGDNYVKVLYPDYGNTELVELDELVRPVQSQFSVPLQAFCACLYNIRPKHQDMWTEIGERLEKFFEEHINDDFIVKVRKVRIDYVVECDIFLMKKGEENISTSDKLYRQHIAQDIVDEGLASFMDPKAAHALKDERKVIMRKMNKNSKQQAAFKTNNEFTVPVFNDVKVEIKEEVVD